MNNEQPLQRWSPSSQELKDFLTKHFDEKELKELCFELKIDYENLDGSTKTEKIIAIVLYAERHGLFDQLASLAPQKRPRIPLNIQQEAAQRLEPNDPLLSELNSLIEQLRIYHERLREWKELHNHLDETLNTMDAYKGQVEISVNNRESLNLDSLMSLWKPAYIRLGRTVSWAIDDVTYIDKQKFAGLGEDWAIKLQAIGEALHAYLEDLHRQRKIRRQQKGRWQNLMGFSANDDESRQRLKDRTLELYDALRLIMYKSDKELRKTAQELYQLSQESLWGQR